MPAIQQAAPFDIFDFVGKIGGLLSAILVIGTFIATTIKPVRKRIVMYITRHAKTDAICEHLGQLDRSIEGINEKMIELAQQVQDSAVATKEFKDAQQLLLRCQMRNIYMMNYNTKQLTVREQRDVQDYYKMYKSLGGNNYVDNMVGEMVTWKLHEGM